MNTQQAYINGFVKRAAEYGYSQQQAETILKQADMQGVLDSMKKGFGNLKNRVMGGYPEPIGPTQPSDSRGYEQSIGPVRPPASEGYDYPIGPTQPDNFMGAMSGGGSHVPSNKSINLGTNLTGNQPSMSPPAALMQFEKNLNAKRDDIRNNLINNNPRLAAGLQGYADSANDHKVNVAIKAIDRRYGPGAPTGFKEDMRYLGAVPHAVYGSIPAGAKGAYNAVQNYNQANPRQ